MSRLPVPREIEVCVISDPDRPGRKPNAYTRYYNPVWRGACIHVVEATTGTLAKIAAVHDHVMTGKGCRPNGRQP